MKSLEHIIREEIQTHLNEVGEGNLQPYEYTEQSVMQDLYYEFTTEDGDGYMVSILKAQSPVLKYQDIYDVEFKVYGYSSTYLAITNKGRVYRIMATIVEIVKNFLNEVRPNILYFQPTKNRGEEDMRRMNLYLAYVKKAASSNPDYFIENTPNIALIIRKGFINPARYEDLLAFQSDIEIRLRQIDPNLPEAETIESLREILQKYISKAGRYYRGEIDKSDDINEENKETGNNIKSPQEIANSLTTDPRFKNGTVLVNLDVQLADEAFKRDEGFYIGKEDKGIGIRKEKVMELIKNGELKYAPEASIYLTADGKPRLSFGDGRHRFAVLRDLGVETINISIWNGSKKLIPLLQTSSTQISEVTTQKEKDGDKYFNNKKTGMPFYDDVLNQGGGEGYQYWNKGYEGEVVYMSPDEYLDKTKKGFGNNRDFDENHILYSRKSQMAIIDAIKQGNKIDMPMLDYSKKGYFGQEGRHRAIVARALGIKEMPVFILYGVTSQDKIKRLNGIIREALKTLDLTGNIDADTKTIQNYIKDNYGNRAHEYMTWTRPDILKNILNRIYEKDNANNDNVTDIVKEEIQNIDEGYKEAYELSIIAGDVINYFSKYNSAMLTNIKNDGKLSPQNLHFDVNNVPLSTIADDLNKYSKEIQDFITSGKVTIRFGLSRNTSGGYDRLSKSIFLNLLKKTFVLSMHQNGLIRLDSNLSTTNKPINNSEELLKKMMNETLKDTIIHELQHAYDAYRSKGRYDKDKQSREYYAALLQNNGISSVVDKGGRFVNIDKYNQYLNLPHEYWARFSQTLNGMDMERDFNDVLNDFKWRFRGYEVLPPEAKKRILNSLYKYHELRNAKAAE